MPTVDRKLVAAGAHSSVLCNPGNISIPGNSRARFRVFMLNKHEQYADDSSPDYDELTARWIAAQGHIGHEQTAGLVRYMGGGNMEANKHVSDRFGATYLGFVANTAVPLAVKVSTAGATDAASAASRGRLIHEAKILSRLSHRNIVGYAGIGATQRHRYLALEYAPHGSLEGARKKQRLSEPLIKKIMKQLLLAVQHMHEKGIIHGAIRPKNVLIKNIEAGSIVLANFGQAQKHTPAGQYLAAGELAYMAPEMAWCRVAYDGHLRRHLLRSWRANSELRAQLSANHHYGKEADMWCVGLTLYYIIYFSGEIETGEINISPEGIELLRGLLAVDKNERLTVAGALASSWLDGIVVPADEDEDDDKEEEEANIERPEKHPLDDDNDEDERATKKRRIGE
ncbi:kinase-like domain-containing protein [Syncephalis pseudoplumigaleata]|uniref:Kinase-like domain-containing protein n=1 Tax=Syncephalis pseudoplumigaleata TaxID=1712513 RepID=A0A4P9Z2M7_9FUNG|nr:kinase-like domain-containing protein [Syncephalis pseudoplumigaleata]|eukprot:RKP26222.1 kinase-like domain-containing protein [Syncephalis pseudoplumigaleata]